MIQFRLICSECGETNNCGKEVLSGALACGACGEALKPSSYPELVEFKAKIKARRKAKQEEEKQQRQDEKRRSIQQDLEQQRVARVASDEGKERRKAKWAQVGEEVAKLARNSLTKADGPIVVRHSAYVEVERYAAIVRALGRLAFWVAVVLGVVLVIQALVVTVSYDGDGKIAFLAIGAWQALWIAVLMLSGLSLMASAGTMRILIDIGLNTRRTADGVNAIPS